MKLQQMRLDSCILHASAKEFPMGFAGRDAVCNAVFFAAADAKTARS